MSLFVLYIHVVPDAALLFLGNMAKEDVMKLKELTIAAITLLFNITNEDVNVELDMYLCYTQEGQVCYCAIYMLILSFQKYDEDTFRTQICT